MLIEHMLTVLIMVSKNINTYGIFQIINALSYESSSIISSFLVHGQILDTMPLHFHSFYILEVERNFEFIHSIAFSSQLRKLKPMGG